MNGKYLVFYLLTLLLCSHLKAQDHASLKGVVVSAADQEPLPGATIQLKIIGHAALTDAKGRFTIPVADKDDTLTVSYLGYITRRIFVKAYTNSIEPILLDENANQLKEVVATGYQTIVKERATGSFIHIDNQLLNRRVSNNILDRLEDITPGLVFNRNTGSGSNPISIRGQSTIFGNARPLIVIDNFPYEGDINNINPNDVESITVLKDAAAASIWGSRAGNGVIVITTKKGKLGRPLKVNLNTNVQIGNRPDLFYTPVMGVSEYIDIEQKLFAQGYYQNAEQSAAHYPLTPVVELLAAKRDGTLSAENVREQISALRSNDVRKQAERYLYRKSVSQQYALSINGGSDNHSFLLSAGHDRGVSNLVGNAQSRTTVNLTNNFSWFDKKLDLGLGAYYTQSVSNHSNEGLSALTTNTMTGTASLYPYASLADQNGNPLAIARDYRADYTQLATRQGLLDWSYRPLDEIRNSNNRTALIDYRLNANLSYKITDFMKAEVLYQHNQTLSRLNHLQSEQSYYTRNLINVFSQVQPNGSLVYPVPRGGILDRTNGATLNRSFRSQLTYEKKWTPNQHFVALAGYEARDYHGKSNTYRLYGYDERYASSKLVDYVSTFQSYVDPASANNTIPNMDRASELTDHYLSYYANFSYTLANKYTLSGSGRLDQSNLFGVKTNQKGVPLWSVGAGWDITKEAFFNVGAISFLKARLTYGYNGNVNKSVSSLTTARFGSSVDYLTRLPYATIVNPPNPFLKWERVQMLNSGLDFDFLGGRIGGSIEYYLKNGKDLVGNIELAPSTGVQLYTGNTADIKGKGLDLVLNTQNIKGVFGWNSNFLLSYVSEKVLNYPVKTSANIYITSGSGAGTYPLEARPLYAYYSYGWAGLDPSTGDPQGYLREAEASKNYSEIMAATTPENMVYSGPARPVSFGSLRNTLSWKNISLSFNFSFRAGYYFRRNSVSYTSVLNGKGGHGDYSQRWQNPGDENRTTVPSQPAQINSARDSFYLNSAALIEKGDHVRLQDINLNYSLFKTQFTHLPFNNIQLYIYANNLGMVWKANKSGIDPDYQNGPPPRTLAFGIKTDF